MGRLLKGAAARAATRSEAELEAGEIVARAREEARRIEQETKRRALEAASEEAAALVAAGAAERDRLLASVGEETVALAIEVARKVIGQELETSPEAARSICARALARVRRARAVVLRVHPEDLGAVEGRDALAPFLDGEAALQVVADADVGRGGCVVESDVGRVDARLDSQLALIERALRQADE